MATRHKDKDGFRLYTTDLKDIRAAAKNIDEKYSALSDREAQEIAKEHDGRKGWEHESVSATKENVSESQGWQISLDGTQKKDQTAQEMPNQEEGLAEIKEPTRKTGRGRERTIEM